MADELAGSMTALERRCRTLLVAYPPDYRAARGDELVTTLLDTTGPGRGVPRLGDAFDVVASGLWQRVGTLSQTGLAAGLATIAPVALAIAAGISLFAWWRVEPLGDRTVGPIGYAAWLLAAIAWLLPRPVPRRAIVASAVAATLLLPVLATVGRLARPPLWVLMALSAFGLLTLAGTAPAVGRRDRPPLDERVAVPAGAVAVAAVAIVVSSAWPAPRAAGYYYQPTIARIGVVLGVAVAALAVVAMVHLVRRTNAQPWLWATVLLGLPTGWFGPLDSAGLRSAYDQAVPQFGRLAQVMLGSSVAVIAMAWLAGRKKSDVSRTPGRRILGCAVGLAAFTIAAGAGHLGFAGPPWHAGLPRHVAITLGFLVLVGLCGVAAAPRGRRDVRAAGVRYALFPVVSAAVATAGAAWLVASYDNDWSASGWTDFGHTTGLVMTLAFVPVTYAVIIAARALTMRTKLRRYRVAAGAMLAGALSWMGYVAVPYVLLWGPVLVFVFAGAAVFALSKRRPLVAQPHG